MIDQHQRLAYGDVEGEVTVLLAPSELTSGQCGWRHDKTSNGDAVDLRSGGIGDQRYVGRQGVNDAGVKRGGVTPIGNGDQIFEDVTYRGWIGWQFTRWRDKAHCLGGR